MIDPQLNGRVAIVTGTNNPHGTGAAIALALAREGVKICAHFFRADGTKRARSTSMGEAFYRAQQAISADWLVDKINQVSEAVSVEADLAEPGAIPMIFDKAESLGPVAILVNNAAYCFQDTLFPRTDDIAADGFSTHPYSAESHDRHFAVNSRAAALAMAEFASRHAARKAKWGRIVNISTDGASGFATEVSYGASKYALESFSRAAAKEFGPLGITVNVASLGPIQTGWIAPDLERTITLNIPLGRIGTAEDVADAVVLFPIRLAG